MVPLAIGMTVITASLSASSRLQAGSWKPGEGQLHHWCAGELALTRAQRQKPPVCLGEFWPHPFIREPFQR